MEDYMIILFKIFSVLKTVAFSRLLGYYWFGIHFGDSISIIILYLYYSEIFRKMKETKPRNNIIEP